MRIDFKNIWHDIFGCLRFSSLSLAEKCRIAFAGAVVLVLILALAFPYVWMGQLTKKAFLDAGRAQAQTILSRHFQSKEPTQTSLPPLGPSGSVADLNNPQMQWVRFTKDAKELPAKLSHRQRHMVESLRSEEATEEAVQFFEKKGVLYCDYARVFRASDACITCHNAQGSAGAFARNELIGAVVIQKPAGEINKMALLNRVWVIVAFLIAGTGAIVAFYMITQRVILRPIRQLRALANNVTEGNLNIRSSIKTGDEYERLSEAFNHMLDGLEVAHEKLWQANRQLDGKIAELSERNIELFKANKVKGEFLANVSHEFRTPLNAILGFAELLREKAEGPDAEKNRRYAENIITGGKSLLNMVNDLLDLAKTEAGKMKLHIENVSISQLCNTLVASFSALTRKKKIKVRLAVAEDIPELTTDAGKVQQILYNFLSNAIKFTPANGRIEISAAMLDEKHLRIAVSDTGCGIAEADREKIFEKFSQADGSITRQTGGSGLGLAISKELAGLLAGSIGLESEVDKGSKFWLDIPLTLAKDENSDQPSV
jgi:two-component system, NarL family, sensor histidine kinase BarA